MQTFSLNTSPSTQKNLTDAVSKNESNVNKLASDAVKTPFQIELTKQAKKQSSQPNQTRPVDTHNKVAQNAQTSKPSAANKPEVTDKSGVEKSGEQVADTAQVALMDLVLTDKLSDAKLLSESKDKKEANFDKEVKSDDVVINQDSNILALIAPNLLVQSNAKPLQNSQNTSTLTEGEAKIVPNLLVPSNATSLQKTSTLTEGDADLQLPSVSDSATKKQPSLDVMLGNALSQTKNTNAVEKETTDSTVVKVSDQPIWKNTQLETAPVKAVREDLVANNVMLNAASELAKKDITASATTAIQPQATQVNNLQVNSALLAQQTGSANTINVYPGKTGWDQAISQKVIWMVGAGEQSASLTLNPPDLGPLKVVIHVHNDQADTTFISDNDEVRQALENGLSNLRDKMNESGIQLGQTNVSTSSQSQQNFQQAAQNRAVAQAQTNASLLQAETATKPSQIIRVANGLVDTFA